MQFPDSSRFCIPSIASLDGLGSRAIISNTIEESAYDVIRDVRREVRCTARDKVPCNYRTIITGR